ncbi:hypothetical protein ACA910_015807 [Epithemia clementina (nom. ined.)]
MESKLRKTDSYNDQRQSMANASWDHLQQQLQQPQRHPPWCNNRGNLLFLKQKGFVVAGASFKRAVASSSCNSNKMTVNRNRKRPRSPPTEPFLFDREKLDSLLASLRTDSFCGEFDPESHSRYFQDPATFSTTASYSTSSFRTASSDSSLSMLSTCSNSSRSFSHGSFHSDPGISDILNVLKSCDGQLIKSKKRKSGSFSL